MFALSQCLFFGLLILAQIIDIKQMPGYVDQKTCVKCAMAECSGNMWTDVGCQTDICLCDNYGEALNALNSRIPSAGCSGTADIASATAILSSFCEQIKEATSTGIP